MLVNIQCELQVLLLSRSSSFSALVQWFLALFFPKSTLKLILDGSNGNEDVSRTDSVTNSHLAFYRVPGGAVWGTFPKSMQAAHAHSFEVSIVIGVDVLGGVVMS